MYLLKPVAVPVVTDTEILTHLPFLVPLRKTESRIAVFCFGLVAEVRTFVLSREEFERQVCKIIHRIIIGTIGLQKLYLALLIIRVAVVCP